MDMHRAWPNQVSATRQDVMASAYGSICLVSVEGDERGRNNLRTRCGLPIAAPIRQHSIVGKPYFREVSSSLSVHSA